MSDVQVTLHGYVGQDISLRQVGRYDVASFRVGTTPRWRDPQGNYRNGETVWTSVTCWRTLAQNVKESVHVGDAVVVIGKARTERWVGPDGEKRERHHVEATTVAHDLAKGTSIFRKTPRREQVSDDRSALSAALDEAEQSPVGIDPATGEPLYPVGTADRSERSQQVERVEQVGDGPVDPGSRDDDPGSRAA